MMKDEFLAWSDRGKYNLAENFLQEELRVD